MKLRHRLTDEELQRIMDCSKPVPYIIIGGVVPESPQDKANRAWQDVGRAHGFVWDTAEDGGTGDPHDVFAEAIPPTEPLVEQIAEARGETKP